MSGGKLQSKRERIVDSHGVVVGKVLAGLAGGPASVDDQGVAGDERGCGRGQEDDGS
jgi:hypothetical protein